MFTIKTVKGDITKITDVQAIVNAAISLLCAVLMVQSIMLQSGTLAECRTLHGCETGEAKITRGI